MAHGETAGRRQHAEAGQPGPGIAARPRRLLPLEPEQGRNRTCQALVRALRRPAIGEGLLDEARRRPSFGEERMLDRVGQEWQRRRRAENGEIAQAGRQPGAGLGPVGPGGDRLGEQRIVEQRHL